MDTKDLIATQPIGLPEILTMADVIARSGLFGMKTPEQAAALMMLCQAERRHPMDAVRDYHIIDGKPSLRADAMMARFQAAGGRVEWHRYDDTCADATFSHAQGGTVRVTWTIEMAKAAGLAGKNVWRQYPRAMLRARVVSEGIRTTYPGVLSGMYAPEEVQDFDTRPVLEQRTEPVAIAAPAEPESAPLVIGENPVPHNANTKAECTRLADELGLDNKARKNAFAFADRDYDKLKSDLEDRIRRRDEARQVAEAERQAEEGAEAAAEVML